MDVLPLLLLLLIPPREVASAYPNATVSALLGGAVTIDCPYRKRGDVWKEKVWCREDGAGRCQEILRTSSFYLPYVRRSRGNTTLTDYVREHRMVVTMKNLSLEDAGEYQCQTHAGGHFHTLREVTVEVLEAPSEMPVMQESRIDNRNHSSLVVMTRRVLITLITGILLSKVLVALGMYALLRRCKMADRVRGDLL
ncbi:triggering receptor expressed on myeloid cells 2-like isoform X2 [Ambystoma mexicanum]|uniref:triggering receptor expressed on myeloid cells 2-like isoform X2 n=1 Tax=Ambystoma mexicanum TaxID=8296 RepID=UPI0037E97294